ncbi:hypothetical protein [Streptomyces sp. NPDC001348]
MALDKDRDNDAARLGYLFYRSGLRVGARENEALYVRRLQSFCSHITQKWKDAEGYLPLRMRARYALISARLNYALVLAEGHSDTADEFLRQRKLAASDCNSLLRLINKVEESARRRRTDLLGVKKRRDGARKYPEELVASFATDMRPRVKILRTAATLEPPPGRANKLTPSSFYLKACVDVARGPDYYERALDELDMAVGLDSLRTEARTDPSLRLLRNEHKAKFMALIDKRKISNVEVLNSYADKLAQNGILYPHELVNRTLHRRERTELATSLGITLGTMEWIRSLCQLINDCPDSVQAVPWINLLTNEGVDTRLELQQVLDDKVELERLAKLAWTTGAAPLTADCIEQWANGQSNGRTAPRRT